MNLDELASRVNNTRQLERLEERPAAPFDPSEGMGVEEMRSYIRFLYGQVQE